MSLGFGEFQHYVSRISLSSSSHIIHLSQLSPIWSGGNPYFVSLGTVAFFFAAYVKSDPSE